MKGILISGYYGFGNSGDDALLLSIIKEFEKKGMADRITVLSANPAETKKTYGVKAVSRMNPFAVVGCMLSCRLFISGGGTLIQDGTSTKSLLYYLYLIKLARIFGKKVMLYANGIGPVLKPKNKVKCRKILNRVHAITVRDERSLSVLGNLGITNPKIKLTADPVFLLEPKGDVSDIAALAKGEFFCVSLRKTKNMNGDFARNVAAALDRAAEKYSIKPVLLPLQDIDREICNQISCNMKTEPVVVTRKLLPYEVMELVSRSCMCVGMRLHMLIYAAAVAVPIVGIVYDPKVSGFMEYANQKLCADWQALTENNLSELIDRCMENRTEIKQSLILVKDKLKALAAENSQIAIELYNGSKRSK